MLIESDIFLLVPCASKSEQGKGDAKGRKAGRGSRERGGRGQ